MADLPAPPPGEAEVLDGWLASHRGKGVERYTHGIQVAFPPHEARATMEKPRDLLTRHAPTGGAR